jgi:hypothetical protein
MIGYVICASALLLLSGDLANAQTAPQNQPPAAAPASPQNPPPAASQTPSQNPPPASTSSGNQNQKTKKDDRMFYVMPNYLTVENESQVKPLTVGQKFKITAEGAFDPYEFFVVGVLAGIRQAGNTNPAFGQGAAGFGKRYGTAFADQVDGNMMVGGVFPSLLHTDPRYFQMGKGGGRHRALYAFSRIFITRKDSGGQTFNFAEPLGNGVATAVSTLYYPAQDRSALGSFTNWGTQMAVDALGNELKEFWPDIHRKIQRK